MARWLEGMEKLVGGGPGGEKRVTTMRWLLIIGGIGIGLVLLNSFLSFQTVAPASDSGQPAEAAAEQAAFLGGGENEGTSFEAIEHPLENRLKDILEKIVGVGSVDVMITVDSTEEIVVGRNEEESQQITNESDKNGGKRNITSITKNGQVVLYQTSGDESPLITKRIQPEIRGVLVVAKGVENATVRRLVLEAVEKGLDVPVNRISVVPRKHSS